MVEQTFVQVRRELESGHGHSHGPGVAEGGPDLVRSVVRGERDEDERAEDTDVYLVPANWPGTRREHWMALLRARAIENQAYVVGVNRVGEGSGLAYTGDSQIIDPLGQVLAAASHTETVLMADLSTAEVESTRTHFQFLPDRR